MIYKLFLSQEVARKIAERAEANAKTNGWSVSIAVVNESGQLLFFTKMDNSTNSSGPIAIAKAEHAANFRRDTVFHQDLIQSGNFLVLALPASMPIEGGVQLIYEGKTIGGIGVSGAPSEEDGAIAKAGADFLSTYKLSQQE